MNTSRPAELFDIKGRVACVTGASSGLGRRSADILVAAGAKVVGVARRGDLLAQWAGEHGSNAAYVEADLADRSQLDRIANEVAGVFGAPDILINAAGINTRQLADDITPEKWDLTMNLNLAAPFFLAQALVPAMKKKGFGRIVNFASLQSYRAFHGGLTYGTSKGGVAQMTRAMAESWSADGITANAIMPGYFDTELTAAVFNDAEWTAKNAAQTCMGRNGELKDIDGPMLFLCSQASAYVTGHILALDGGFTAK